MCTHNDVASDYEEEALWEDHHSGLGLFTFWGYLVIFLILSTAVHPLNTKPHQGQARGII